MGLEGETAWIPISCSYNGISITITSHVPDNTTVMIENGRRILMSKVMFDRLRCYLDTNTPRKTLEKSFSKSRYDIAREG